MGGLCSRWVKETFFWEGYVLGIFLRVEYLPTTYQPSKNGVLIQNTFFHTLEKIIFWKKSLSK